MCVDGVHNRPKKKKDFFLKPPSNVNNSSYIRLDGWTIHFIVHHFFISRWLASQHLRVELHVRQKYTKNKKKSTSSSFLDYILFFCFFWKNFYVTYVVLPLCACWMYYYLFLLIRNEIGTLLQRTTLFSWLPHFHQERTDESHRVCLICHNSSTKKKKEFPFNFLFCCCFVFFKWWRRRSSVFV